MFLSLNTWQESEEIMYLSNALGYEENRSLTVRARNPICHQCGVVVLDVVLPKGR